MIKNWTKREEIVSECQQSQTLCKKRYDKNLMTIAYYRGYPSTNRCWNGKKTKNINAETENLWR